MNSLQTIPPAKPAIPLSAPVDSSSGNDKFKSALNRICPDGKDSAAEKKGPLEEEGTENSLH
ncbi:MAG: hypothetical protein K0U24_00575 [Gammaproteobacteria bacterium]|nr:hypothetical protein [Gammaproteobacteria bacterium]MCH9762721.1 hypothetical protein [Gammaproteobacteria bacterium]